MWSLSKFLPQSGGQSLPDGDRSVPSQVFMMILQSVPSSQLMLQSDPSCLLNFDNFYWQEIEGIKTRRQKIRKMSLILAEFPGFLKDCTMVLSFPLPPSLFSASLIFELLTRERRGNREKKNKNKAFKSTTKLSWFNRYSLNFIALYNHQKGAWSQVGADLLCQVTVRGLNLCQRRFRLDMMRNFFTEGWPGAGRGCPGKCWNHWKVPKGPWMWHLGTV